MNEVKPVVPGSEATRNLLSREFLQKYPLRSARQLTAFFNKLSEFCGAKNFFRVSCSHTAEAGRISRGALAPQRSAPAQFFLTGPPFRISRTQEAASRFPEAILVTGVGNPDRPLDLDHLRP